MQKFSKKFYLSYIISSHIWIQANSNTQIQKTVVYKLNSERYNCIEIFSKKDGLSERKN
jgi:hypothetical protein